MFGSISSCLRRHKKKLFFLGGVFGGVAILNTYLKRKLKEWESQRTAEICDQIKRSSHFDGTMQTCNSVFISFASKIRQAVVKSVDVNPVVTELNTNPKNKVVLWEQLKILVFTQAMGEMFAQCVLCVLLRVQMSILSGYVFTTRNTSGNATKEQQTYMSRIEDFMLNGINSLLFNVKTTVEETLKSVPLNRSLKLQDIGNLLQAMKNSIFQINSTFLKDTSSLMPASSSSGQSDEFLKAICCETRDVMESNDFFYVLQACVDCGVSSLLDRISECYVVLSDGKNEFVNPHDYSAPLAKLIPMIHNVFSQHEPTEQGALVHSLLQLECLNNFAANIYEAFSQKN